MNRMICQPFNEVIGMISRCQAMASEEDSPQNFCSDDSQPTEDDTYDFEQFEEVFADHLLMDKRIRKRFYAGEFDDLDEIPSNPPIALTGLALELFTKAVPNYGLDILDMDYVSSISDAARISPCAMILAMMYLERLKLKDSDYLDTASPSGLFVVTMMVASKFLFEDDEDIVTNQIWAETLNFDIQELNQLEYEFLSAIDWKVFVNSSDYFQYLSEIEKVVAIRQSSQRGWLSYSDIYIIIQDAVFQGFWSWLLKKIAKLTILWTCGYVASALTLYGTGIGLQKIPKVLQSSSPSASENIPAELDNKYQEGLHVSPSISSIVHTLNQSDSIEVAVDDDAMSNTHYEQNMYSLETHPSCVKSYRKMHPCNGFIPKSFPFYEINIYLHLQNYFHHNLSTINVSNVIAHHSTCNHVMLLCS